MRLLHNDHNVFILGAGFSADGGLPLVKEFMFKMRDALYWLEQQNRQEEIDAIAKVLEFRASASSAAYRIRIDLENIEELFSLASASASSNDLSDAIRIAIAATLDYCNSVARTSTTYELVGYNEIPLLATYAAESDGYSQPPRNTYRVPDYEYYLRSALGFEEIPGRETSFVSFNYDTVVEETLSKLGVKFSYGLENDAVDDQTSQLGLDADGVKLLKLHGSVNWGRPEDTEGKLTVCDSYAHLRRLGGMPDLIPPTWRKIFDGNLEHVWSNALHAIKTATRIIVIGFSVPATDNHFKYLLAAGLQSNISLRDVIFVNPEREGNFAERIDGLFTNPIYSRVSHKPVAMREFLGQWTGQLSCNRPLPSGYAVNIR